MIVVANFHLYINPQMAVLKLLYLQQIHLLSKLVSHTMDNQSKEVLSSSIAKSKKRSQGVQQFNIICINNIYSK